MADWYFRDGSPLTAAEGSPEWTTYMNTWRERQRVALDEEGDYSVSTVFLGLNHGWDDGVPLIFETMIFAKKGEDGPSDRYSTEAEAVEGHAKAVEWAREQTALTAQRAEAAAQIEREAAALLACLVADTYDPESAHLECDELCEWIVRLIADGYPEPQELASLMVPVLAVDFTRWYA